MENKDPIKKRKSGNDFESTCAEFKIPLCSTQSLPNEEGFLSLLRSTPALHAGSFPAGGDDQLAPRRARPERPMIARTF
jgi:hypothetical protein